MKKRILHPLLLCLMLAPFTIGCSGAAPVRNQPSASQASNWESDALRYANRLRTMTAGELNTEADTLQKNFANRRTEESRLRLALFHAIAPIPQGDRSRALSLFDVPASDVNGRGRNHPLAQLFLPLLQDYRRLDENLANTQFKLRDEQKRSEALQQNNEQMRQKLDAIRDIEVKIQERPASK